MARKIDVTIVPGTYFAGVDVPWYIPNSMIVDRLMSEPGVTGVWIYPREGTRVPVTPQRDPLYTNDWEEWIRLRYDGEPRIVRAEKVWAWMVMVPRAQMHQLPPFVPPPPPAPHSGKAPSSSTSTTWASSPSSSSWGRPPARPGTALALMTAPAALLTLALAARMR